MGNPNGKRQRRAIQRASKVLKCPIKLAVGAWIYSFYCYSLIDMYTFIDICINIDIILYVHTCIHTCISYMYEAFHNKIFPIKCVRTRPCGALPTSIGPGALQAHPSVY